MKKISSILNLLASIILSLMLVNAVQSFTLNPTGISDSVTLGETESVTVIVTNTGNETLSLGITDTNLVMGSNTVPVTVTPATLTAIAPSAQQSFQISYSPSGVATGTYVGSVTLTSTTDSSVVQSFNLNVNVQSASGAAISLNDGDTDNTLEMEGEIDEEERVTFTIENTGSVDLQNVRITFSDLEGRESGDDIDSNSIEFTNDDDEEFDLDVGDKESVRIEIDIPRRIDPDVYEGVMTVTADGGHEWEFDIELTVEGGDEEINFVRTLGVRNGVLRITGEAGENVDDYELEIENEGDYRVNDITFEVDGAFREERTGETLPASILSFSPKSIDLDDGDDDTIDIEVDIPSNAATGTYITEIKAVSSTGRTYDEITVELRVVGDVFIHTEDFGIPEEINPGDSFDLTVTVENTGSRVYSNVKITATLEGVDIGNNDIVQSSNSFLLRVNDEHEEILRFRIPQKARDGTHTLEIRVRYDDEEVIELEQIRVVRPEENVVINSYGINPSVARCENSIYAFYDIENLGRFDEDVIISAEIVGEAISARTGVTELDVDERTSRTLTLDISNLEPGQYEVEHTVEYGSSEETRTDTLRILECSENGGGGVIIEPIDENETDNETGNDTRTIFGQEVNNTTLYLAGGVGVVFILIIVSLFFI